MVLQMQKLQSVADALGVNLKDGRFLVEGIVKEELIERVAGLAKDGALLEDLNKRIREKFEKFEKELKDKNAGVEDVEYKNYKAKITEEHKKKLREEIKNIPLKEKAKQSPKFVENLKKLEEVNRQINNLENRLNAGLERFNRENGETGKLSIVDILRKNEKEREKNENGKENIAGTSTVLNTLSQSCTTVPGSNIPTSNATQKANINTNTKETSFS
jgi:(p)ppGpp synthase/HD superfamily hydrolase